MVFFRLIKSGLLLSLFFCITNAGLAQGSKEKKYPSLLWEITGKGLKKPSYLFGTMHVSNKMVFHLSDSFFIAIKNSDVVGLELNSDTWQSEMVALEKQRESYNRFYGSSGNDLYGKFSGLPQNPILESIKEYTFRQENYYIQQIQAALKETPYIINSLLYRTQDYKQDFEENTFLDMYIHQTGKKLGKQSAGMETIFTMEKYTTEAEIDRANEKTKKNRKYNYDDMPEMTADEAYRRGDLDMLDSLDRLSIESEAFVEKFLYQRNDVQANSMDTIMQKGLSLFVGVGASHLPGKRGVIEILRNYGYKLRPIKMVDRNATERNKIDKIRVPVSFVENVAEDQFYRVKVPGKLYARADIYSSPSLQYADMSNGTYYMVSRVPTTAKYFGLSENLIFQKIDSLLYENIPGTILRKTKITRNGYIGLDITNKTRRGDEQRYHIFVTPFEVLLFKMSGNENYVSLGKEAQEFFGSIQLKENKTNWATRTFTPGNYSCYLPQDPYYFQTGGNLLSMAIDAENKVTYLIQKTNINSTNFKVEDSFKIVLMEESFIGNQKKIKTLNKDFKVGNGITEMIANYALADSFLQVKYLIKANLHYMLIAKGKVKKAVQENKVLPSFKILPFPVYTSQLYNDSFLKFSVKTPFIPVVADTIKALFYKFNNTNKYNYYGSREPQYESWGKSESMRFENDNTGESINVTFQQFGKYFFVADSFSKEKKFIDSMALVFRDPSLLAKFADSFYLRKYPDMSQLNNPDKRFVYKQNEMVIKDGYITRTYAYTDTGSTQLILNKEIMKDDYSFRLNAITDTAKTSTFIRDFFESFQPFENIKSNSIYQNKSDSFFNDYYSKDTLTRKISRSAIPFFSFSKKELPLMFKAFQSINIREKDYFDTKNKWITAIATINDSTLVKEKINFLKDVYEKTTDTSIFQNNILNQLVALRTKESYNLFKQYLLQDPPVTVNSYDYGVDYDYNSKINFFNGNDSLALVAALFPDILDLASIDEYKTNITNALIQLVDSNKIDKKNYEKFVPKILFDAKIALKKKLIAEEKMVKSNLEMESNEPDEILKRSTIGNYGNNNNEMIDFITLLIPFYDTNHAVPVFVQKLWKLKDEDLKFKLLLKVIDKNLPFPDTMIQYFADQEAMRGTLYYKLAKRKKSHLFPVKYLQQDIMAKSFLYTDIDFEDRLDSVEKLSTNSVFDIGDGSFSFSKLPPLSSYGHDYSIAKVKMDSVVFIRKEKLSIDKKEGLVYIYKYRKEKADKWRLAFSGFQPLDGKTISYNNFITTLLENPKINEEESLEDQIQLEWKKIRFSKNPKSEDFFQDSKRYSLRDF